MERAITRRKRSFSGGMNFYPPKASGTLVPNKLIVQEIIDSDRITSPVDISVLC